MALYCKFTQISRRSCSLSLTGGGTGYGRGEGREWGSWAGRQAEYAWLKSCEWTCFIIICSSWLPLNTFWQQLPRPRAVLINAGSAVDHPPPPPLSQLSTHPSVHSIPRSSTSLMLVLWAAGSDLQEPKKHARKENKYEINKNKTW